MQLVTSIVGSVTSGVFGAAQINAETEAAQKRAEAEADEINRLRAEEALRAQEERADRIREADAQAARVLVAMAETGGIGGGNVGRFLGEVGGAEGLDLARIAGDSKRRDAALASEGAKVRRELGLTEKAAKMAALGNTIDMFKGIAGGVTDEVERRRKTESGVDTGGGSKERRRSPSAPSRFVGLFTGGL